MDENKISTIFKALSDENRVRILNMLMEGETCACNLLKDLHMTQPTLAHHMQILCASGLVQSERVGRWMHYRLHTPGCSEAQLVTQKILRASLNKGKGSCC